jgi:hypothetical protein
MSSSEVVRGYTTACALVLDALVNPKRGVRADVQLDPHIVNWIAARTPCVSAPLIPFSIGLMNSLGMAPPTISFSNT